MADDDIFIRSQQTNFRELRRHSARRHLPMIPVGNKAYWLNRIDMMGEDEILGMIANGMMEAEIASEYELPMLYLREWITKVCDKERLKEAKSMFASVSMLKAELALEVQPMNPAEATAQKTISDHHRFKAQMADPESWTPPKNKEAPAPSVSITFDMGSAAAKVLDGTKTTKTVEQRIALDALTMDFGGTGK